MAKLIIARDAGVLQEVELSKERMTIGRHSHNDIVIAHQAVSGQHAAITSAAGDVWLEDLGSTNGTFVNGHKIARQALADRDQIMVAKHRISFVAGPLPGAAAGPPAAAPTATIDITNGASAGRKLTLTKPLTTLGTPGVLVVVIGCADGHYFIRQIDGSGVPLVNDVAIGRAQRALGNGDLIELAGTRMRFALS